MTKTAYATLSALCLILATGCDSSPDDDTLESRSGTITTHVQLETFQIPEVVPNTTLDETEAVSGSSGNLKRKSDSLRGVISTHGLPNGVYTFWWHLTHEDGEVSILWAGYDIVDNSNGNTSINTVLDEGEENAPGVIFIGHGLQPGAADSVRVELWTRLHGPASEDPDALEEQLTQPFGLCTDTRNPNPRPGEDFPCWNPQRAVFGTP